MNKTQHEIAVQKEEEERLMILKQADEFRERKRARELFDNQIMEGQRKAMEEHVIRKICPYPGISCEECMKWSCANGNVGGGKW